MAVSCNKINKCNKINNVNKFHKIDIGSNFRNNK